jgi:hypothetical protein
MFLTLKTDGALMSYQSFLEKGSTLRDNEANRLQIGGRKGGGWGRERANSRLLLATLLPLGDPLVLADCHCDCRLVPWM